VESQGPKPEPDKSRTAFLGGLTAPQLPAVSADPQPAPKQFALRGRWVLGGAAATLAVVACLVVWALIRDTEPPVNPDLPEWFQPIYRIPKNRGIVFPPKTARVQAKAQSRPKPGAEPAKYSQEWLEKHFTHYIDWRNGFVWSRPRVVYPSDGKILAGVKVILGEQVDGLSLICTVTPDGQPENMYVQSWALRDRSQGPPPRQPDE